METILIGEYIKRRRKELGLTQEQVCEGLCDPVTLSRLENGKQTPRRNLLHAILQRLGMPADRYYAISSKNEVEMEALKKEIVACNIQQNWQEGRQKIKQLRELACEQDSITQQFILRSEVLLGKVDGRYSPEEQKRLLLQAIRLTIPQFDLEKIGEFLYTYDEIKIINQIAGTYSLAGRQQKAADLYAQLLSYIYGHYQEVLTSNGMLPTILFNYARALDLCGRYAEAVCHAEQCQNACVKYGHYQYLPGCLAILGECCYNMGEKEKSKRYYIQAYYLFQALKDYKNLGMVQKEMKKYHQMEMPY